MHNFITAAPSYVLVLHSVAAITTVIYFAWKAAARNYCLSPFTTTLLVYAVTLIIAGPAQYSDEAWIALGAFSAGSFFAALNAIMTLSLCGYLIIITTLWVCEYGFGGSRGSKPIERKPTSFRIGSFAILLSVAILAFLVLLLFVGTVPLFGGRTVFNDFPGLRPIYNFVNLTITFSVSVLIAWSAINRNRSYFLLILLGMVCQFLTGSRASFLSSIELVVLLWIYQRDRRSVPGRTVLAAVGVLLIGVFGIYLSFVRNDTAFSTTAAVENALTGNTFSDVRDGAFVYNAWLAQMNGEYLGGNTYIAALMSVVPSSLSDFRQTWSWGYFSTSTLLGWSNHYGLRGGWSLESFMNFGVVGVIATAVFVGLLLAKMEKHFYLNFVVSRHSDYWVTYAWSMFGVTLISAITVSSATYNLYSTLFLMLVAWGLSFIHGRLQERSSNLTMRPPLLGRLNM